MARKSNNPNSSLAQNGGVAREGNYVGKIPDIATLIDDRDGLNKALDCLVELLNSTTTHYDPQLREHVLEIDGATRTKAAQILIEQRVGQAVKRQQILTGKIPEGPVDRGELKKLIDAKLSARINSDNVTTAELVAAKKALVETEDEAPSKLTPLEREAEVRRILGVE